MKQSFSYVSAALILTGMLIVGAAGRYGMHAQAKAVSDGVFTEEQATRGAEVYEKACASCHMPDLRGEGFAPQLNAEPFSFRWQGGKLGDLLKITAGTMPMDNPGSLKPADYADIVAFLLKSNGYNAGQHPLSENSADLAAVMFPASK